MDGIGRRAKGEGRRAEGKGRRAEGKEQRAEVRGQRVKDRVREVVCSFPNYEYYFLTIKTKQNEQNRRGHQKYVHIST